MQCHNAELAAEFLLLHCRLRHGKKFLCAKTKRSKPPSEITTSAELLRHYNLKGVREDSHLGLLGWLEGRYPLEARIDIPSPREMLDTQCEERRIATLLLEPSRQFTPIGRHAGAYEFLLHDLEHAHKFFGGEFQGQVRFFLLLRQALDAGAFGLFHGELQFQTELDYLMSDMNSHPVHLLKYLKAIVLAAIERRRLPADQTLTGWSSELFRLWAMPETVAAAALRINYPDEESDHDRSAVARFFTEAAV